MSNAYLGYVRVSTVKQGEHGSSLQEQKSAIEAYAARHGLELAGWYEEMETAARQGRRHFARMLAELRRGKARGVIIHKIDRSARNLKDWAQLGDLIDAGVDVRFAHESLDLQSRGGRLAADIQAVVAADYVRNLRDEVRKGFYGRLKQGFWPLVAPVGYLDQGKARPKVFDPERAPLVRDAFELYASGGYTQETLRLEMERRGLRGRSGKPLSPHGFARMLHNPFYVGLMRIERTGETFEGVHEPLVSRAVFDEVQARMAGRVRRRDPRDDILFRRMIDCRRCGHALVGEQHKGRVYYRCHTASCRTSLRQDRIEARFVAELGRLVLTDQDLRDLRDFAEASARRARRDQAESRRRVEQALGVVTARIARLTDAVVDGVIDRSDFEARKGDLIAERQRLEEALASGAAREPASDLLRDLELGDRALRRFGSDLASERRAVLTEIVRAAHADGKALEIELRFPFDRLADFRRVAPLAPACRTLPVAAAVELRETASLSHERPSSARFAAIGETSTSNSAMRGKKGQNTGWSETDGGGFGRALPCGGPEWRRPRTFPALLESLLASMIAEGPKREVPKVPEVPEVPGNQKDLAA